MNRCLSPHFLCKHIYDAFLNAEVYIHTELHVHIRALLKLEIRQWFHQKTPRREACIFVSTKNISSNILLTQHLQVRGMEIGGFIHVLQKPTRSTYEYIYVVDSA